MKFLAIRPLNSGLMPIFRKFAHNDIKFIRAPRLALKNYAESAVRAQQALESASRRPSNVLLARVRYHILRYQYNWSRSYFECNPATVALCWNGLGGSRRAFMDAAKDAGAETYFFEHAPFPGYVTVDSNGVNFRNSLPRSVSFYREWQEKNTSSFNAWTLMRDRLVSRKEIRSNSVLQLPIDVPVSERPYFFCPLQVHSDSQIRLFGGWIASMDDFIEVLIQASRYLPEGWFLRIKEHPSSKKKISWSRVLSATTRVLVDNTTDTLRQVKSSYGVITVNSSVGLEAMFFGKPVIVLGAAFYQFDGLAIRVQNTLELQHVLRNPYGMTYDRLGRICFLNYLITDYYKKL